MFGFWKRRKANEALFDALYASLSDASRQPAFYAMAGVPDTVEGRFDLLTLHAILVLERLKQLPPPADDFAQDFVDDLFGRFDAALREMGVGDISVPKRMKRIASHFMGRAKAYNEALAEGDDAMAAALARNVFGDETRLDAGRDLNRYVNATRQALSQAEFSTISEAAIAWPQAATFLVREPT
jgi:cytochrome b pre-mRNA-processing protein 3